MRFFLFFLFLVKLQCSLFVEIKQSKTKTSTYRWRRELQRGILLTLDAKCLIRLRSNNKIVGNFSSNSSTNHLTMCLEKQTNMLIHSKNWEQPKLISFSKHNLPQTYLHYSFYLHFYFCFSTSSFHNISLFLSLSSPTEKKG